MTHQPLILEIGTGIDLHGHNATEAARRAVWNAVHQSSLMGLGLFGPDTSKNMIVEVTVAISRPDEVDEETVLAVLPHGTQCCQRGIGNRRARRLWRLHTNCKRCRHS